MFQNEQANFENLAANVTLRIKKGWYLIWFSLGENLASNIKKFKRIN